MPTGTYEFISSFIFSTPANSHTFTSIPATYDDFIIIGANITATEAQTMYWQANGDTSANYAQSLLLASSGFGAALTPSKSLSVSRGFLGSGITGVPPTKTGGFIMQMNQYSQSSYPKVAVVSYDQSDTGAEISTAMWTGTAAVYELKIFLNGGNFKSGTRFSMYGIKKAV